MPEEPKAVESAALEAAGLNTRGSGLGVQWHGLSLGVPRRPEPPGAPWVGAGAELRHCLGVTLTMLPCGSVGGGEEGEGHGGGVETRRERSGGAQGKG